MIDNDNVYDRFMVRIKKIPSFAIIGIILSLIALLTPTVDLVKGFLNKENIEEGLRSQRWLSRKLSLFLLHGITHLSSRVQCNLINPTTIPSVS